MSQVSQFIATHFANYSLANRLPDEGACEVWQVVSKLANAKQPCAVLYKLRSEFCGSREVVQRFTADGRRVKQLVHPNIAKVQDVIIEAEQVGIVVDAIAETTLRTVVEWSTQCSNTVPLWFALHVTSRVCDALQAAHCHMSQAGRPEPIYNLNLGLDHVGISETGVVKVHGFGIARPSTRESWSDEELQACSPSVRSTRSDITAAAKLLYQLLTRVTLDDALPTSSTLRRLVVSSLAPASIYSPWVPRTVDSVLRRALAPHNFEGFTNVRQFRDALYECLPDAQKVVTDEQLGAIVHLLRHSVSKDEPEITCDEASDWDVEPLSEERPVVALAPHLTVEISEDASQVTASQIDENSADVSHIDEEKKCDAARDDDSVMRERVDTFDVLALECIFDEVVDDELPTLRESVPPSAEVSLVESEVSIPKIERLPSFDISEEKPGSNSKSLSPTSNTYTAEDAITVFEQGLDCMRRGDFEGAETAWIRALELNPELRAAATNLNVLRKRRNSMFPSA